MSRTPSVAMLKRIAKRNQLWPDAPNVVYDRKSVDGFGTIPRILSLVLWLLEHLSDKGKNLSRVYIDLWCRNWDDGLVEVLDPEDLAFASGLSLRAWRDRVAELERLGFIRVTPEGKRPQGNILLLNPHLVVKLLKQTTPDSLPDRWWSAYLTRSNYIGYKIA